MKKIGILICLFVSSFTLLSAQKYWTQNGEIDFFSEAPLENIEAKNNQVSSIIDIETGEIVFSLLMKAFQFEKALMQEHFNEKYVESTKFPKSTFKGAIENIDDIDFSKAREYEVIVAGDLTMHGKTQKVSTKGVLIINEDGTIDTNAKFDVLLKDYDIKIPSVVKDNIAEEVEITVNMHYVLYNK